MGVGLWQFPCTLARVQLLCCVNASQDEVPKPLGAVTDRSLSSVGQWFTWKPGLSGPYRCVVELGCFRVVRLAPLCVSGLMTVAVTLVTTVAAFPESRGWMSDCA